MGIFRSIIDTAQATLTTKGDLLTYGTAIARLGVGTDAYVLTADSSQASGIKWAAVSVTAPQSFYRHTAYAGRGSTNTAITTWSTTVASNGSDITYASSASDGDTWTINTAGIYSISIGMHTDPNAIDMGISRNSNQLTTSISTITSANKLAQGQSPAGSPGCVSWTGYCAVNDIIRGHFNGDNSACTNNGRTFFSIYRVL